MPDLSLPEGKGGKTRRRMTCDRQINLGLLAVKMIRQQISLTNRKADLLTSANTPLTSGGNDELEPNTAGLVDHHL